jgi:cyclophilin family peptidyl-prolyl cis-trans isomerase/HEAT repeat protein
VKFWIFLALLFGFNSFAAIDPLTDAGDRKLVGSGIISSALMSSDPEMRVRAAFVLGRMQDTRGLDPLLKLLKDPNERVREAAVFNAGQYGWKTGAGREAEIQAALTPLLSETGFSVRKSAVEALGKVGLANTPELVLPYLSDRHADVRAEAALALARYRAVLKMRQPDQGLAELAQPVMEALLKLQTDRAPQARKALAFYFSRNADGRGEAAMAKLTHDRDQWVRLFALGGLAKMKAKGSKKDIVRELSDVKYYLRLAALNALIASEVKVSEYPKLASDSSWHVRAAYARGLNVKDADEAESLKKILKADPSLSVKVEAIKSLAKDPGFDVTPFLTNPEWPLREAAVQSSGAIAQKDREAKLIIAFGDENKNVKAAALEALASISTATAFEQIKAALTSNELSIRGTAVSALAERKELDVLELAWKTYMNSMDPRWVELREEIVGQLAKSQSSNAGKYLRVAAKDPAPSVGMLALEALIKRGEKDLPAPAVISNLSFTPYRDLTFTKNPVAVFETNKGTFKVEAFAKEAPVHTANFIGQVKAGLYNGLLWHRVVSNFVVQGGDPDGTGWGDAGYSMRWEVNRIPFERGTLGMPRATGFDTGGVQLFFNHVPTPHLDSLYTVFGRVTEGMAIVDKLERGDKIVRAHAE